MERPVPADHERVSTQELAKAVAAIEARKAEEARQQTDTVLIGDAIRLLDLDMTPDELHSEIHARRLEAAREAARQHRRDARRWQRLCVIGASAFSLAFLGLCQTMSNQPTTTTTPSFAVTQATPALPAPDVSLSIRTTPEVDSSDQVEIGTSTDSDSNFQMFSEVAEDQDADMDFDTLQALARGKAESDVKVGLNLPWSDKLWTVKKSDGRVLVHCFANSNEAAKAMNGQTVTVYASPHADEDMSEWLIPLSSFKNAVFRDLPDHASAIINL